MSTNAGTPTHPDMPLRRDYERLVLSGTKRVHDEDGIPLLDDHQRASLGRLIVVGLAAQEGPAFVLRSVRDTTLQLDADTRDSLDQLHQLWLRLEDDATATGDEVLYGDVGYWQHWWNVLNDGTDRALAPMQMDMMIAHHEGFLSRQWTRELDPEVVAHVFSEKMLAMRVIVPPATRGSNAETVVENALSLGVEVRVFPSTSNFSILDGTSALLHDEHNSARHERYRLTRRRTMVEPLRHLFDLRWSAAMPWETFVRGSAGILELLARGWTDARIAEATGTSPRTVSRRVSELLVAAGAQSRFELGMKYALHELGPHLP